MKTVAALYVDPKGPYFGMDGVDPWDAERDARNYPGPHPIVAHPPCGPWGTLRKFCTKQDPNLAPLAVGQLLKWGGVLEHPAGSALWRLLDLPRPGEMSFWLPLWTLQVQQCDWGHKCRKRTWLLFAGISRTNLPPFPPPGEYTHRIGGARKSEDGLLGVGGEIQRHSPPRFAEWLVECARRAVAPEWGLS